MKRNFDNTLEIDQKVKEITVIIQEAIKNNIPEIKTNNRGLIIIPEYTENIIKEK